MLKALFARAADCGRPHAIKNLRLSWRGQCAVKRRWSRWSARRKSLTMSKTKQIVESTAAMLTTATNYPRTSEPQNRAIHLPTGDSIDSSRNGVTVRRLANESEAYTESARGTLGVNGSLQPEIETLDAQVLRWFMQLGKKMNNILA